MSRLMGWRVAMLGVLVVAGSAATAIVVQTPASAAPTATWTGATSNLWSVATNWQANAVPASGDALVFPVSASNKTMVNDIGGSWDSIDFQGTAYNITGTGLSVANGITSAATNAIGADITLTGDQTFAETGVTQLIITGIVDVNGHTLTISNPNISSVQLNGGLSGTGTVINSGAQASSTAQLGGTSAFTGTFQNPAHTLFLNSANAPNTAVSVSGGSVLGTGTIGTLTATGGAQVIVGSPGGTITATNPTFSSGAKLVESLNTNACASLASSGTLAAVGTVTITGATLQVAGGSDSLAGQECVLIDNDGSDAVVGTFTNYPEGAYVLAMGSDIFQISYTGGDGNDVTLSAVGGPEFAGAGTLRLMNATGSIAENGSLLSVVVMRFGGADGTANYTLSTSNGTATGGTDYVSVQSQDNLGDGETIEYFNMAPIDDNTFEGDETFTVGLSQVSGATLGAPSSATITIVEDDADPGPTTTTTAAPGATTTTTAAPVTTTTTPEPTTTTIPATTTTTTIATAPDTGTGDDSELPHTGANPWGALAGTSCLLLGAALLSLGRRRQLPR